MGEKRQKRQEQLAFPFVEGSEASRSETEGIEAPRARRETENPAGNQRVMEEVCERENRRAALKRVRANQMRFQLLRPNALSTLAPKCAFNSCAQGVRGSTG